MCTHPHEHLHIPLTQREVGVGREGEEVLSADYQTNIAGGKKKNQIANLKNIIVYDLFYLNYAYMCLHLYVGVCMCTADDDIVQKRA